MIFRIIAFIIINFAGLGLGGLFTSKAVNGEWYTGLKIAPWTPPGWVFGVAWTIIMLCFAIYMAYAWQSFENKSLLIKLFVIQWLLNFMWNPVFFSLHQTQLALIIILSLTFLIAYLLFINWTGLKFRSILILPYFFWLLIATSLNAYVCLMN